MYVCIHPHHPFSLSQVLSVARRDLKAVTQERSHVLDLICHETISCPKTAMTHRGTLVTTPHRMTVSADGEREERYNIIDPLGPYTPEVDRCLLTAKDAQIRSAILRRETAEMIDKTERIQRAVHQSVNDGVVQKIAETVTLKVCWLSWQQYGCTRMGTGSPQIFFEGQTCCRSSSSQPPIMILLPRQHMVVMVTSLLYVVTEK